MSALSLASLGMGQAAAGDGAASVHAARTSVEAFNDALQRQGGPAPAGEAATAGAATPAAVPAANVETGIADREHVLKTLKLDGAARSTAANGTTGDTILGGIQKLKGVFDARTAHLNEIMNAPLANTQGLMAMQMEMAQYTIMVDVSSKLTGKASSSLDTLMKGQ